MREQSTEPLRGPAPSAGAGLERGRTKHLASRAVDATLVLQGFAYVPTVARRYRGYGLDRDELVAAGNLGLVQAARRFDASRGVKFITYADWWIRKSILEALENQLGPVRLPRHQHEKLRRLKLARSQWTARFGSPPAHDDLAAETGMSAERITRLFALERTAASLDGPAPSGGDRLLRDCIQDTSIETRAGRQARDELAAQILRYLADLLPVERTVISLRFGLSDGPALSLREVGEQLGVSRERVRQIEARALRRLQARI